MTRVVAVTVTYGDRFDQLCRETISRALRAGAAEVVAVDNGSVLPSSEALREFAGRARQVVVLRNEANLGSAAAFGLGLACASERQADFIWLLDDDNWVEPSALSELLLIQREEAASAGDPEIVVCARRVPNSFHSRICSGLDVRAVYPPPGAFMGFDWLTYMRRWQPRTRLASRLAGAMDERRPRVPYAPYGGLLLRPSVVSEVGRPDSRLVLYADDTAWTSRIVSAGHDIVLATEVVIEDAERKWSDEVGSGNSVSASVRSSRLDRLYLSTRNRVWYDRGQAISTGARLRYLVNRTIVMGVAAWSAFWGSAGPGLRVFRAAARDGEHGDFRRVIRLSAES